MGVSPCGNLEVLEDLSRPGVLTALVVARSPNSALCPAWHHRASHLCLPWGLVEKKENREGKGVVFGF